jgi:hypothetical protein
MWTTTRFLELLDAVDHIEAALSRCVQFNALPVGLQVVTELDGVLVG